jgi:hypothetical protein
MKKILFIGLLITSIVNAQISTLTPQELEQKIELDTKVETSKNYLIISAAVTTIGFISTANDDINVLGFGAAIAGMFTTPYHFVRHKAYVYKRNKFYKQHNISKNK